MKKILITGGNGFIGSALSLELFKQGYQVYIIDKVDEPHPLLLDYKYSIWDEPIQLTNLKDNLIMASVDILDMSVKKLSTLFASMDLIIHLASPIGVDNIIENSNATMITALKMNLLIQEACESSGTPLIFSSSSEVFGSGEVSNDSSFNIKQPDDNPRWSYAAQKVASEFLFATSSFPSSAIRFFNIIGPGQVTPGMIGVEMINAVLNNIPITIKEDGIRNYCYIDDAITQIILICDDFLKNQSSSIYNKKSYNIGSGAEQNTISASEFANLVMSVAESNVDIVNSNSKQSLPIRKLKNAPLSGATYTPIKVAIEKIYKYKKEKYGTNSSNE